METIRATTFAEFTARVAEATARGERVSIAAVAADGVWQATTYEADEERAP